MLKSLHIKNIATYSLSGVEINNFNKVNFIFGGNGCGKTTISNFLHQQTHPDELIQHYSSCQLQYSTPTHPKIHTYNKKFRDLNFHKDSDIPGVFTLGQATIEQTTAIDNKKNDLVQAKEHLLSIQDQIKKFTKQVEIEETESTDKCWSVLKQFELDFRPALLGSGFIGSKVNFRKKILSTLPTGSEIIQPHASIVDRINTLFTKKLETIPAIHFSNLNPLLSIETSETWKTIIIGKSDIDLAKLINTLNITDWVNQGRTYIEGETCPFCQKETIDNDFKLKLEEYFDKEFENKVSALKKVQSSYESESTALIDSLQKILNEETSKSSKLDINEFSNKFESLKNLLRLNIQLSRKKLTNISSSIKLNSSNELFIEISNLIQNANLEITKHNNLVTSHTAEKTKVTNDAWNFLAFEANNRISPHESKIFQKSRALAGLAKSENIGIKKLNELTNELSELNTHSTSVQPAVDEINRLLIGYGFTNFEIAQAEKNNHYWIKRSNGDNALHSLSEGEATFITFLYFLQVAKGSSTNSEVTTDKILVIDDPISSLDSNILFIVSTLIKTIIKDVISSKVTSDIKQIIILTHNVYFHKEVSFQLQKDDSMHVKYWILRKQNNLTSATDHGDKNPISSSYQMLWHEIKESHKNSTTSIQNIIRRILENYFKILGSYSDTDIIKNFDNFEEQKICQSLLHWINDGSHCIPDDLFIQPLESETSKYLDIFERIFKHSGHEAHYNMMMGIKTETTPDNSQIT